MTTRVTYGQGFMDDCDSTTGWAETEVGLSPATLSVVDGDFFKIEGTCDDAGNEYVYYEKDIANIASPYTNFLIHYKTSASAAPGLQAKVDLVFTDASTQTILPLSFNSEWTTITGTITIPTGESIDKIRIFADDDPATLAAGTYQVYYDFIMLFDDWFTFPFMEGTEELECLNNIAYLQVPGRVGNITQYLGAESPTYRINGHMDTNTTWGTSPVGKRLYQVWLELWEDQWQWLESDLINCKVTVPRFVIRMVPESGSQRTFTMEFRKYDLSSGDSSLRGFLDYMGF